MMLPRHLITTALATALLASPVTRAQADAGDFIAGAIVGGVLGHATRVQPQRKVYVAPRRTTTRSAKKTYRPRIPATQEGRQIQTSLNYFGFNAGRVDGQLGRKSRDAISAYQAYMGYPVTGNLSTFEQDLLVSSYNRAQAGGTSTQTLIAQTPDGTRGLLKKFRSEMAGQGVPMAAAPFAPVPSTPAPPHAAIPAAPAVVAPIVEAATELELAEDAPLPNLFGSASSEPSLASHCNSVSLVTNSNGGFTTLASMSDPEIALSEQFCLARTYAISEGEQLAEALGADPKTIVQHCEVYGERMAPHVAALSLQENDSVIAEVATFVMSSGVPAKDLEGTAKICLSLGYRTDNMEMAIGSALLLTTVGQKAYGELLGHHLRDGFGTSERPDLSLAWYGMALDAAEAGQGVFAPHQTDRAALLRKAAFTSEDNAAATPPSKPVVESVSATLPTFSLSQ